MKKLSVVISAYNEEKKIGDCLKSVQFADEIIMIDNESTDKTAEIAKKLGAKVYSRPNNLMLNVNKNYGFTKATGEWILNLDADERVTPHLENEIKAAIANDDTETIGYWFPRRNMIFGKWIRHNAGWYPDLQLRLFRKDKGKFPEKNVHEKILVEGKTDTLTEPLDHLHITTIAQFLHKHMVIYAPNEAERLIKSGYVFDFMDVIKMPTREFLNWYFAREGYKDGFSGLVLGLLMAFYHMMVFCYIWEKKGFVDIENNDFLDETKLEIQTIGKDLEYWYANEKLKQEKNPGKKILLKIHRKLGK